MWARRGPPDSRRQGRGPPHHRSRSGRLLHVDRDSTAAGPLGAVTASARDCITPHGRRAGVMLCGMSVEAGQSARRADIQGLRAVAVLAVIGFHVLGWPRAGYLGVDAFFVVSG